MTTKTPSKRAGSAQKATPGSAGTNLLADILAQHKLGDFPVPLDKLVCMDTVRVLREPGVEKLVTAFQQQGYLEYLSRYIVCPSPEVRLLAPRQDIVAPPCCHTL